MGRGPSLRSGAGPEPWSGAGPELGRVGRTRVRAVGGTRVGGRVSGRDPSGGVGVVIIREWAGPESEWVGVARTWGAVGLSLGRGRALWGRRILGEKGPWKAERGPAGNKDDWERGFTQSTSLRGTDPQRGSGAQELTVLWVWGSTLGTGAGELQRTGNRRGGVTRVVKGGAGAGRGRAAERPGGKPGWDSREGVVVGERRRWEDPSVVVGGRWGRSLGSRMRVLRASVLRSRAHVSHG